MCEVRILNYIPSASVASILQLNS
uniref:Uncharacterized protein n=1 Tax=Rhizophora mucronata TaxID=61149 RepID=A0A2P2Q1M5_RHIMU